MKTFSSFTATVVLIAVLFPLAAPAQLVLAGTNYFQNFNAPGAGLPTGWTVRTNATAIRLGDVATNLNATAKTWGDTTGEFGFCASIVSNSGTNFIGTESTIIQAACTNRALAVRQTSGFGDPGAAFVLQISNTIGVSNLTFSADLEIVKSNNYSTTWSVQYAVGSAPQSFTTLGTFSDPGAFGATRRSYVLGPDTANQPSNLWIRIAALTAASGSGSRDTFALDNVSLSWTTNQPVIVLPCVTAVCFSNGLAQVNFTGDIGDSAAAFILQTADDIAGPFFDTPGAAVIQTAPGCFHALVQPTHSPQFYRIKRP
ncbi:MAG TPA: hypothetical protein VN625_06185 [Desulfuromonadaceae bacterium]|nr:hypothetical protein [Desulfuromonadaceae bacterium]